jgi:glycine cleavage system H lipoate-binding protein
MAKKIKGKQESLEGLLRTLTESVQNQTIVQLGLSGIPQQAIRKIVGVDMKRVTKIVKHLKKDAPK